MAVKSFIRGDFRTLIIDNDYPTNYKAYYNGRWNYIQDEESFINRLNPNLGESYLNRFNLKVLDNNKWVRLAILDNYYNKNEKRNSIFYRVITKENFNFKPRAVNFTEVDARLGLNNLQTPFASNEIKYNKEEIEEITDRIQKDEILYKLGNVERYNELDTIHYKLSEKDNFESNTNTNFLEDKTELDYYYDTQETEMLELNNSNTFEVSDQLEITDNCITFKKDLSNAKKVKEVLINNWKSVTGNPALYPGVNAGGIFRFYDENGSLIESGNIISYSSTNAETENFIIECYSTWYKSHSIDTLGPHNAVRTDLNKDCTINEARMYVASSTSNNEYLKITFKTPQYIKKILSNPLSYYPGCYPNTNYCEINLIYENNTQLNIPITATAINQIITSDYLTQVCNISDIQYFCTTINKFENFNVNSFSKFSLIGKNLNINSIDFKIALSFDENNYFVLKDGNWSSINKDKTEIFNNGMNLKEFASITKNDIKNYFGEVQKCDLYFSLLNKEIFYEEKIAKFEKILKIYETKSKQNYLIVDQILINNFTTYNQNAGGIFRFYDENGDLIESGKILHYTGTYAESENFIMESYDYWTKSGTVETISIMNAFRTDLEKSAIPISDNMYVSNPLTNNDQYALVKFKTLKKVSKIECNIRSRYANYSNTKSCTVNLMLNDEIIKSFDIETDTQFNIIQTLENFNDMLYYDDSIGIIKTSTNQIQNIDKIEKIQIIAGELKDTKVKIALSVDSKNTYLKFDGINWNTIQENDVINNGNTIDEINNLTYQDFFNLDLTNKTLDFIVCMETSNIAVTPNIKKIIVTSINKQ